MKSADFFSAFISGITPVTLRGAGQIPVVLVSAVASTLSETT